MSTALDARKAFQSDILGFTGDDVDGEIGPKSLGRLHDLTFAADDAPWPPAAPETASGDATDDRKRFDAFMPFIIEWETEYRADGSVRTEHDENDPGGTTRYGIDARSHPGVNIDALTLEQATDIYWSEWQKDGCTVMESPFAEVFFNCAVNMGLGRAKEFDGHDNDARAFIEKQEAYYKQLGASAKYAEYLKGWLNRTTALRQRFSLT